MMDDYLNHLISSSAWVDGDTKQQSSWGHCEPSQPNVLLPDSLQLYQDDKRNSAVSIISSNHSVESLASQDTSSVVLCSESNYAVDKGIIAEEALLQRDGQNSNGSPYPNEAVAGKIKFGNMGLQCDTTLPNRTSLNYPKQLPVVDDFASCLSFIQASNSRCEQSEHHISFKNLQNLPSIPQLWHSASYESGSSQRERMEGFGRQGGNFDDDMGFLGKRYLGMDKILQLDKLSTSATTEGQEDLQSCPLSSFTSEPNITVAINPSSSLPQATSAAPEGGCSGTGKPRIRARRGQATDPHSIAERLRREKITERMKSLQELVPNSNKVDKASMLDEIIEYVKFLQLQVKVLSMSRLGAAGAVIPLLTDGQAEGSKNLSLSASAGLGIDISSSPDQIAFEQEVLKLMETNITMAMQYLQSKGLCLMPMALAAAISGGKASFASTTAEERKKFIHTNGLVHHNSSSSSSSCGLPGTDAHLMSYDGSNIATRAIKQEELKNA